MFKMYSKARDEANPREFSESLEFGEISIEYVEDLNEVGLYVEMFDSETLGSKKSISVSFGLDGANQLIENIVEARDKIVGL